MDQKFINKMKTKHRVKLDFNQALSHYCYSWYLLVLILLPLGFYLKDFTTARTLEKATATNLIIELVLLIIAVTLFYIQWRRLQFIEFNTVYTDDDFAEALKRTSVELKWKVVTNRKDFVQAISGNFWERGEMISIIKANNRLFVNSICNPNYRGVSLYSKGNIKNINAFLNNLNDAINKIPQRNIITVAAKEWTLNQVLIRAVLYLLSFMLIIIGIFITTSGNILGIALILFSGLYLYTDIQIITKKKSINSEL